MYDEGDAIMEEPKAASLAPFAINPEDALIRVLKESAATRNLLKGARQCLKAIDKDMAYLCVVAKQQSPDKYNETIKALCREKSVNIVTISTPQKLAILAGICKLDSEGEPTKNLKCGCVVIKSRDSLPEEEVRALENFIAANPVV